MIRRTVYLLALCTLSVVFLASALIRCAGDKECPAIKNPQPSIYFWRTTYRLTQNEKQFLKNNHIRKIYMRFFDVVSKGDSLIPNATILFTEHPDTSIEIIPVIFITEDCLYKNINSITQKLVNRIIQICKTNNLKQPKEIQIDCDYTSRSRKRYYDFLSRLHSAVKRTTMKQISVTIRLHQLSMPIPEDADYGVLMMYNTGDVSDYDCKNPILSFNDVKPYLKYLHDYRLPLCTAYPCFRWQLLFQGDKFKSILHEDNLSDSTIYKHLTRDKLIIVSSRDLPSFIDDDSYTIQLNAGDSLFIRECPSDEILKVKAALEKKRKGINCQVILYDLNEENIKRYNTIIYEKILNH